MDAFLLADWFLIDNVDDIDTVQSFDDAQLARELVASRSVGFNHERGHQRAGFPGGNLHRAVSFQPFEVAAGQVKVIVQRSFRLGIVQLHVHGLAAEAHDGAGLIVHAQRNAGSAERCAVHSGFA